MSVYCVNCMLKMDEPGSCPYCGFSGRMQLIPHQLKPGTVLNERYLVGRCIGQGGFGITYIGLDTKLETRIAIKEYYPNSCVNRNASVSSAITVSNGKQSQVFVDGRTRFFKEARAVAKFIGHPGIVDVRDFFEENNTAYIIMEYLEGCNLEEYLNRNGIFCVNEIIKILMPVMDALEKMHEEQIIHRDISPDNIMVLKDGSVKLMDFGAARSIDFTDQKSLSIILKAGYAPEEQYRSKGHQGAWTDVYALCATIYKCITGIKPEDALQRAYEDSLQKPSDLGVVITTEQEYAIMKGLEIKHENRLQCIGELKELLLKDYVQKKAAKVIGCKEGKAYGQKRNVFTIVLSSVCAGMILLSVLLVYMVFGRDGAVENRVLDYPTERVMLSNAAQMLKESSIEGAVVGFKVLREEWKEKFNVYIAEGTVEIRKEEKIYTYEVKLIYELEKEWIFSEQSEILNFN